MTIKDANPFPPNEKQGRSVPLTDKNKGSQNPFDTTVDAVIIGYNATNFNNMCQIARQSAKYNGFYSYLTHNSVKINSIRQTYGELFNTVLSRVRGVETKLHVSRLPNLAGHYLASFLHRRDIHAQVINSLGYEKDALKSLLKRPVPAVVIPTTFYLDPEPVKEIVTFVRKHNSTAKTIAGGPYIRNVFKQPKEVRDYLFEQMGADIYVNSTQGELTLSRILMSLRESSLADLKMIPNLSIWVSGKEVVTTPEEVENNCLDETYIDYSLFAGEDLGNTVQTRTARGCPFKCAFCSHHIFSPNHDMASMDTVRRELAIMKDCGIRQVVFIDDSFNVPLQRFKELCRMMIQNRFEFNWFSYFRPLNVDDEAIDLMIQSGCTGVFMGIENANPEVLRNMNKASNVNRIRDTIKQLNQEGVTTFASFVIGFPGESSESVKQCIAFIEDAAPTFYRAELWYCDPLSPISTKGGAFDLHGMSFNWRHGTMSWQQAAENVCSIYSTVMNSVPLPVYDFDFWSLPYWIREGFSVELIRRFADKARPIMVAGLSDQDATETQLKRLEAILGKSTA